MITDAQRHRFDDEGYLLLDDYFGWRETADFAATMARLRFDTDGEVYDAAAMSPAFLRLAAKRETEDAVNALLGRGPGAPLYCFTNRCRIDRPGDNRRTYGWHQEVFYTVPHGRFLQTWAPLIRDTTVANGTIEICPGSHREGIARQRWTDYDARATQILVDPDVVAKYPAVQVPMQVGQILIFDGRLFHRSGRNTSNETRYSLVGMYHATDAPGFRVPRIAFDYRGETPREWYRAWTSR